MQREYLEEDVRLVQKYFPGARTVTLRTPFDLTVLEDPWQLRSDTCAEDIADNTTWYGDLSWNRS